MTTEPRSLEGLTSLDDFLNEEGVSAEVTARAEQRVDRMTTLDVDRLRELRRFLYGTGAMRGMTFGEPDHKGRMFWWREELSRIDDAIAALTSEAEARAKAEGERDEAVAENASLRAFRDFVVRFSVPCRRAVLSDTEFRGAVECHPVVSDIVKAVKAEATLSQGAPDAR